MSRVKSDKIRRCIKRTAIGLLSAGVLFFAASNLLMMKTEEGKICTDAELKEFPADCILILGAGVWSGGTPSPMLADRLDRGLELYLEGVSPKILVSGDHGQDDYDEVNVMKKYLLEKGVPGQDIFMDHAGFTTYESMYRARDVFGVGTAVVVTQKYHLYRALYICDQMGIDAKGSAADTRPYHGAVIRNIREWLSREKAILWCLFNMKPKYLGDPIDIHGNGDVTNDK